MLGNFFNNYFAVHWFVSNSIFSKNSFWNTIRVSNSLDPDQARHFVGPDLGPYCLQRLSETIKFTASRQRVNRFFCLRIWHQMVYHFFKGLLPSLFIHLRKWSKISDTSGLPNRPRQTDQTQIRLLLKKQSDQGLLCLLFWQAFCEFQPWKPTFYLRIERENFKILENLL